MEHSFGIIPLRWKNKRWETLLVKHIAGHWAFPKGHPKEGENFQETASRELYEETSLRIVRFLPFKPLSESYVIQKEGRKIQKRVTYFLAEVKEEVSIQVEEIEDFKWLAFEEVQTIATFPETRAISWEAEKYLFSRHKRP
ncbi:MAG: NUDIX domain-containing protein [Chlamydiales bacterium]